MTDNSANGDPPFIIWTLQRTGGTNLAQVLFERSSHRGVQHEPFNVERLYGAVTQAWLDNEDEEALRVALGEILAEGVLIKHCVEKVPGALNRALAELATQAGYRHVFLYRRQALSRLLSYHFAQVSGVWGRNDAEAKTIEEGLFATPLPVEKLLNHERRCRGALRESFAAVLEAGGWPFIAVFEDIFQQSHQEASGQILTGLLQTLQLQRPDEDAELFERLLKRGAQGTRDSYRRFVNYEDFAAAATSLGAFDLALPELGCEVVPDPSAAAVARLELWDPVFDPDTGAWQLSGALVLHDDNPGYRLVLDNGGRMVEVQWQLRSQRMETLFPELENAARARFVVDGFQFLGDASADLFLIEPAGTKSRIGGFRLVGQVTQ